MARQTSYFVQAFNRAGGGNLKADLPIACKTENGGFEPAERLARASSASLLLAHRRSGDGRL